MLHDICLVVAHTDLRDCAQICCSFILREDSAVNAAQIVADLFKKGGREEVN